MAYADHRSDDKRVVDGQDEGLPLARPIHARAQDKQSSLSKTETQPEVRSNDDNLAVAHSIRTGKSARTDKIKRRQHDSHPEDWIYGTKF